MLSFLLLTLSGTYIRTYIVKEYSKATDGILVLVVGRLRRKLDGLTRTAEAEEVAADQLVELTLASGRRQVVRLVAGRGATAGAQLRAHALELEVLAVHRPEVGGQVS